MACAVAIFKAFRDKTATDLGNFWNLFVKSITRLLLPLSIIMALIYPFSSYGNDSSYIIKIIYL
jgi:K+-transporting ATPase ATPase A chain